MSAANFAKICTFVFLDNCLTKIDCRQTDATEYLTICAARKLAVDNNLNVFSVPFHIKLKKIKLVASVAVFSGVLPLSVFVYVSLTILLCL